MLTNMKNTPRVLTIRFFNFANYQKYSANWNPTKINVVFQFPEVLWGIVNMNRNRGIFIISYIYILDPKILKENIFIL